MIAALAWPRASLAAPRAPEAPRTSPEAQARFDAGVAAYQAGRYRDAVESFKQADELAPSPLLSFNIAKVYERMADNRNALASYRTYLRRLPQADNRASVEERIAALEQTLKASGVQQVTIISAPEGATVSVDNVSRGVTPWTGELIPGPHTLALRSNGYRDSVTEMELPADHAIDVDLTMLAGTEPVTSIRAAEDASPAAAAAVTPAPSTPASPAAEGVAIVPRWWTWAMFGGSAAAFIGAGAFELSRSSLEDEARDAQIQVVHQQKYQAMESRQTAGRVFLGIGVVAALAGSVSLYLDVQEARRTPGGLALDCEPTGCTLAAGGRF